MQLSHLAQWLLVTMMSAIGASGCTRSCTLIGFEDGLKVTINVPPGAASYRVEIEAEGDIIGFDYVTGTGEQVSDGHCKGDCFAAGARIQSQGYIAAAG